MTTVFTLPDDHPCADIEFTPRKPRKVKQRLSSEWKQRYQQAHEAHFKANTPAAYEAGHYSPPVFPDARKTNGITNVVVNYLTWKGIYCNRINTMGRQVKTKARDKKWIPSSTRKGTADLDIVWYGKSIKAEVKNKYTKDTQSHDQEKEQDRVTKAGGVYIIITCVEDFFEWYDKFVVN